MSRVYAVKEMFLTLQGEGQWAGARAVFIRFAGCNVWSGREQDRERDAAKGCCARWCDTEFVGTSGPGGGRYTAPQLAGQALKLWGTQERHGEPRCVLTGGEPALQVDEPLLRALETWSVHVETNGSVALPPMRPIDWVTLSPKPPMPVVEQRYDELKVVGPNAGVDALEYARFAPLRFVQPLDSGDNAKNVELAVNFVLDHPGWRLSLQQHKLAGLP